MLRNIIKSVVVGAVLGVVFAVGHHFGYNLGASTPDSCSIPQAKTVAFLESELSKCFKEADLERFQLGKCRESMNELYTRGTNQVMCEDRNLWFIRAHNCVGIPVRETELLDCTR